MPNLSVNFLKVGQKINQILEEFEILEKTIAVTTDGGSEYSKALLKNDIGKSY